MVGKTTEKLTELEIEQQIEAAKQNKLEIDRTEPKAKRVSFDRKNKKLIICLENGCIFSCPINIIQGVCELESEIISTVTLTPNKKGLRWEEADIDLSIPGLLIGIFGTKSWMKEIASKGGKSTSELKKAASRENGKKGGRPRKNKAKTIHS
ncbi:MAG: DUF2442 domain-containing protein [Cyanobacteria bacterium P01_G01_bin.19]